MNHSQIRKIAVLCGGVLLLSGCGLWSDPLKDAHEECRIDAVSLSYNSRDEVLTARSVGSGRGGELDENALQVYSCLIDELEIPSRVQSSIENTAPVQGQRSAEWDGFEAYWTADADTGLTIHVEES